MMKDTVKTLICVFTVLIVAFIIFLITSNVEQGIELFTKTDLTDADPDVKLLFKKVKNNHDIRKAALEADKLTSQEIITFTIDNLTSDDYTKRTVKAEKIVCNVAKGVSFITDTKSCKIRIISDKVFENYQKELFNTNIKLDYVDINYHGYDCQHSGSKYYCLYSSYKDYVSGYSVFKSAYKTKDSIVISEYYLEVDVSDNERCNTYFDKEYCANYKNEDKPSIKESVIKKDGVIYEHTFKLVDDKYYLNRSIVKLED